MHHLRTRAPYARLATRPVALAAAALLAGGPALAQPAAPAASGDLPVFVEGDRIRGTTDVETIVEGDAVLRRGDTVIRADRLEYRQPTDTARASGNVRIDKAGNVFEGPLLQLQLDSFTGFFNEPRYRFLRNDAYGEAERIEFLDENRAVIRNATYTTCQREPGPSWMPDWVLRAASIRVDQEEEEGQAEGARLEFYGVPILPVPSLTFPLTEKRKSGLLPPTIGLDNVSGLELTLPYYWNIAPNRDATLYPTLMSKRGIDFAGEFRYLEPTYNGSLRANILPNDRVRDRDRWGYALKHQHIFPSPGEPGAGSLQLNINRVSDDNYWRDFSRSTASLTQRLLAGDAIYTWGTDDFTLMARTLKWQVLQDPAAPIIPPYERAPQVNARWTPLSRWDGGGLGLEALVEADYTHFTSDRHLTLQPDAHRAYTLAQVSWPLRAPGWFVVPRAQVHATSYRFDAPVAGLGDTADRVLPTVSLDTGLVFERETRWFGRDFVQTLEPRAFYTWTPFRDQSRLPIYDTWVNDFNFATIYSEHTFSGWDRIADNNLLTVGATTRLLDPETGAEAARFGVAQRIRFEDQRVTLPGVPTVSERLSDLLFGASVTLFPHWGLDTTVQYNYDTRRSIRSTLGGHWSPGPYKVVSAAYRLQRGFSEQLDLAWQWPLNGLLGSEPTPGAVTGRWYSVGRLNVSLRERRLVDAVVGLEYDAGCWLGRVVLERFQVGTSNSNKRILFQLEFVGFTRLGSNALQSLRDNIPRYQYLREEVGAPSRFTNYD